MTRRRPAYSKPAVISWARCHGDCFSDDKLHTSAARRVTCAPSAATENAYTAHSVTDGKEKKRVLGSKPIGEETEEWSLCVAAAITSYGSSDHSSDPCHLISDGLMTWPLTSLFRCRVPDGTTTPRQCYISCTGLWFGNGWTLICPPSFTAPCSAWRHRTWPWTVSSSLMRLGVGCVRPTRGRVSSDRLTASSVTDVLQPQAVEQSSS